LVPFIRFFSASAASSSFFLWRRVRAVVVVVAEFSRQNLPLRFWHFL